MNLKDKAIDIKGKKYVLVSDRVLFFNENFPNGSITTELLENGEKITVKATITPDVANPTRVFVGHSQAKWGEGMVNRTSALENAESSAWGRALAAMGIGVLDSIASVDEMKKAGAYHDDFLAPTPSSNNLDTEMDTVLERVRAGTPINVKEYEKGIEMGLSPAMQDAKRAAQRDKRNLAK